MEELKNIDREKLPKHIGLILDGNRRWARENNMASHLGHLVGYRTLRERLFDFFDAGIRYLTIYALSLENARKRSPEELNYIYKIMLKAVDTVIKESIIREENIKINVIGRLSVLPKDVQEKIEELNKFTKDHNHAFLNVCIMYDGQEEIVDAVKKIIKDNVNEEHIDRELIKNYLYTNNFPELDYIIRTGMEDGARISGFLLWDASYAEFKFRSDYWPDYSREMLIEDLKDYIKRVRRKGK
ncbi:MAG: polyprenyl diphosphate synthase [Candidatus Hodarchaeota archaeon]